MNPKLWKKLQAHLAPGELKLDAATLEGHQGDKWFATGQPEAEITQRIAGVDKKSLDTLLKEIGKAQGSPRVKLLKAELEAVGSTTHSPRFSAKEVK